MSRSRLLVASLGLLLVSGCGRSSLPADESPAENSGRAASAAKSAPGSFARTETTSDDSGHAGSANHGAPAGNPHAGAQRDPAGQAPHGTKPAGATPHGPAAHDTGVAHAKPAPQHKTTGPTKKPSTAAPGHGEHAHEAHGKPGSANHQPPAGHATTKPNPGGHAAQPGPDPRTPQPPRATPVAETPLEPNASPADIFARRILPIARSDSPSSCTQCHFSGVRLQDYVGADQAETFASLRAAGLIDVQNPDASKLLTFIARKPEGTDPLAEKVRTAELAAFRTWIRAAVRDPQLLAAKTDKDLGITLPPEVVRHARRDRVLASFVDAVWSETGRCVHCHSPEQNRRMIGQKGKTKADIDAISWFVPRDPAATLKRLVEDGDIDPDAPESSPLLTKPAGLVEHGGGPKFLVGSPTYRNIAAFLRDYAAVVRGDYRRNSDLPAPPAELVLTTEQHLRVTDIPARFADLPMQVDLYRWDDAAGTWSTERWGTAMNKVNGKDRQWQSLVQIAAPSSSPRAESLRANRRLPDGRYLARVRIDRDRRTARDPAYELTEAAPVGEMEFRGPWKPGYQPPMIVRFADAAR